MVDTTVNSLLNSASTKRCKQLAENVDLQGKRAKALLALNNGDSHSVAAEKSGLTTGQISYLLSRFKKIGMKLFIASRTKKAIVKKSVTKKSTSTVTKPVIDDTEIVGTDNTNKESASNPLKAKGKKKKTKKDNKTKKTKKTKKDKKSKKNKKNKKSKKNKK